MSTTPSSNWLALKHVITPKKTHTHPPPPKRRRLTSDDDPHARTPLSPPTPVVADHDVPNRDSLTVLRNIVHGNLQYTPAQLQPGKFLALDCEMVGVGIDGAESALARVSLVNYHGAVQLDEFVRPRERVVDYRTAFSGVRESDMVNAKPFRDVQTRVAALLKDRVLVGHAVFNDLKALLLSHPRALTRDTQHLAGKHKLLGGSKRPALRRLVHQELALTIQSGEHSSVTDARATMALYRLHRKTWDKDWHPPPGAAASTGGTSAKRKRTQTPPAPAAADNDDEDDDDEDTHAPPPNNVQHAAFPGGGRKGVSSGLSTVRKALRGANKDGQRKEKWWATLGGGGVGSGSGGAKGSVRLHMG